MQQPSVFFGLLLAGMTCISAVKVSPPPVDCRRQPVFMTQQGFDLTRTALSTSEQKYVGLTMIELEDAKNPGSSRTKVYQHPSWDDAGYLGPFLMDAFGDVFVAPIPVVNLLKNKAEDQNSIYKVDGKTGQLYKFMDLPMAAPISRYNPFGLLGLAYDCDNQTIYATSVAGSTRAVECGRIYHVNPYSKKVVAQLDSVDAMGVGVGDLQGEKRLYFGKTRTGEIMSVALDKDGNFVGKPRFEFTLEGIGVRGDDKARKIRFNAQNDMIITAVEFYYNLTAPTEKQESTYIFKYDSTRQKWVRTQ